MRPTHIRHAIACLLVVVLLLISTGAVQAAWKVLSDVGFEEFGTCRDGGRFLLADANTTAPEHYHLDANLLPGDTEIVGSTDFTLTNTSTITTPIGSYLRSGIITVTWSPTRTVGEDLIYHFSRVNTPDPGFIGSPTVTVQNCMLSDLPLIMTQPASQIVFSGKTATLNVIPSGTGPLSFQWYEGDLYEEDTPVGANSGTFTTSALTNTTSYWVRVTNAFGEADSVAATMTVVIARNTFVPLAIR